MRRNYRWVIALLILVQSGFAFGVTTSTPVVTRGNTYDRMTLLVKFKDNVVASDISNVANRVGANARAFRGVSKLRSAAIKNWRIFSLPASANITQVRKALLSGASVERVEFNYKVSVLQIPNDASFSQLWGFNNIGQTGGTPNADIDAPEAWDITTGSANTLVAVIDTGVDYTHPDLIDNIWTNPGEIPGNGIDDDLNGYIDDVHGYDFANNDGDPMDDFGHGTHVSGTIAAAGNNGIGVAGVNWQAQIMAVKFLDATGSGTTAAAVEAVLYATNMGAKVSNNSWGGGGFSQALLDAINAANTSGALFVAAAGNSSSNNDALPQYPASYDAPNIISVAATDHNDLLAFFSNYGATTVDLGAPGVSIYSTVPAIGDPCCSNTTGYMYLDGTSMATPHVTGAAALLMSYFPTDTNLQVKQRILGSVQPIAALSGKTLTGGRLNIFNSLENDTTPPAPVVDLSAASSSAFSAQLTFTATGDDNNIGVASSYDIRYSTSLIDDTNFDSATSAIAPLPAPSGTLENVIVEGLQSNTTYYFALKVADNVGNKSPISNIATVTTLLAQSVYSEDFENGLTNWTISGTDGLGGPALWHLSSHRYNSPSNSLYYGDGTSFTYNTGAANSGSAVSAPIDLTLSTADTILQFYYYLRTENLSPYDTAEVSVSNDGGVTWAPLWSSAFDSPGISMVPVTINLSGYVGSIIQLQFSFNTLDSVFNDFEGWVVDDINILTTVTTPINNPPVAVVGGPYSGTHNVALQFDGSGSSDPDGDILTYSWDFGDTTTATGATPTHVYSADGNYTVTLTVSDGSLSSTATTSVSIVNSSPLANAGGPYSGAHNIALQFDGSGSSDPNGDSLVYYWDFGDTTSGTGINPSHVYSVDGVYTVALTVSDGSLSNVSTATVTIVNTSPLANAGGPYSGTHNVALQFDGSASSDPNGDALVYSWDFGDTTSGTGINPTHVYNADGIYTVTLTVSDGGLTNSATTTVNISNTIPVANAGGPYSAKVGYAIQFDATSSSDVNNDPLSYTWDFGDGNSGTGANPSHIYTSVGVYNASLVVNDSFGDSIAAIASVTIVANKEPVANAGSDQTVVRGSLVTLDASASHDPDGTVVSYRWEQISGNPPVTLTNANEPIATFTAPNAGAKPKEFGFLLTVTDNDGSTGTDEVIITVTK